MNSTYYFFFNLVTSIYTQRHMESELEGGNRALKIASHPEGKCDRRGPSVLADPLPLRRLKVIGLEIFIFITSKSRRCCGE